MWRDVRRLRELRDESVNRDWMWAINPAHGTYILKKNFQTCIRLLLGAYQRDEPKICPRCEKFILDRSGYHALCCGGPQANVGHTAVRDIILDLVRLVDSSARTEEPALILSAPTLRPADIFTSTALPGCQAALDTGICSPDASGAGDDCCESMRKRKLKEYGEFLDEMAAQDIRYIPLTFSCYGRAHPETLHILEKLSARAARKFGMTDHRPIFRRTLARIGIAIWNRAAEMIQLCSTTLSKDELTLLFGSDFADEDFDDAELGAIVVAESPATLCAG